MNYLIIFNQNIMSYRNKSVHNSLSRLSLIFLLVYLNVFTVNSLHAIGTWKSEKDFFYIISKFGFQKTNLHEIELSEGYIFGNVTSHGKKHPGNYGVLALLPHQYFVPFYRNGTQFSSQDKSQICQNMFKGIKELAYDARCHDSGKEDFLRKVPCPKSKFCADEDNPKNVMDNMQLTYAIQDINNPRFWYLSFVACKLNASCQWVYSGPVDVHFDLHLVNGKPESSFNNIFEYHFSFEKQDTVEIYLICLLYYGLILVPFQMYAAFNQVHPITRLFTITISIHLMGLVFDSLHLLIYSVNGFGVETFHFVGDICNIVAQSLFMMLLLLMAKGWAITKMSLSRPFLLFGLWLSYTILIFLLYFWNKMEIDVIEEIDEFQTWPGWLTLTVRVFIMLWFLYVLRDTMQHETSPPKLQFFLQFGAASLVWFIYLPIVALIALQVSALWRYKLLLGFTYCADLLGHSFLAYALWPRRSEQYLLLAEEIDLSEELAAFDEAPHVLNSTEYRPFFSNNDEIDNLELMSEMR